MSGKTIIIATIGMAASMLANAARANEISMNGVVSSGSSMGLISGSKGEYSYDGTTKSLAILRKGCPVDMGELAPCTVRFKEQNGRVTEIIAASAPSFGGVAINRPGSVFDAFVCDRQSDVDYSQRPSCTHIDDLAVQVFAMNGTIAKLKWNGQVKYAFSQRVTINCAGTSISLASYVGKNFPPGMKRC